MGKLRVLDLFSGIGGFSLGLERTGGFETVAFCEIEPFCQKVLKKHWPEVPCYDDVSKLTGKQIGQADVITAGWPCQDASISNSVWGDRLGIHGERTGLFSEITRLAGELGWPTIVLENTTGILAWLGDILGELAKIGYDAEWHCIPLASIGAPHYRDRFQLIAYHNSKRQQGRCIARKVVGTEKVKSSWGASARRNYTALSFEDWNKNQPSFLRMDDGVSGNMDIAALGNSYSPRAAELIGHAILEAEAANAS